MVGRGARVERHHDGAASPLPRVHGPEGRRDDDARHGRAAGAAAARRPVVDLPRRRAGPERDTRGVRGAPARRPVGACSSAGRGETILRGAGRDRWRTGLHAYLVVAFRNLALGRGASALPGARAAAAGTARVPLHVCLLGASDRAPAVDRHALQAGAKDGARTRLSRARSRPARAGTPQCLGRRRPAPQALCAQPVQAGAQARACPRGTLDHRPAGARRILGRYSASLGVVVDRARLSRARPRFAVPPARASGLERVPRRRRRQAQAGGMPVACLGQRPRAARACRVGCRNARPSRRRRSALDPRRGGENARRLGDPADPVSSPAAGRSSTRTTCTRMSTTPPSSPSRWTSSASAGRPSSAPVTG